MIKWIKSWFVKPTPLPPSVPTLKSKIKEVLEEIKAAAKIGRFEILYSWNEQFTNTEENLAARRIFEKLGFSVEHITSYSSASYYIRWSSGLIGGYKEPKEGTVAHKLWTYAEKNLKKIREKRQREEERKRVQNEKTINKIYTEISNTILKKNQEGDEDV